MEVVLDPRFVAAAHAISLPKYKKVKALKFNLRFARLRVAEFDELFKLLKRYPIVALDIIQCAIENEEAFVQLIARLTEVPLLTSILIRGVRTVTDKTAMAFSKLIQERPFKNLELTWTRIGPLGAQYIGHALNDSGLEHLNLSGCRIGLEGAMSIIEALDTGTTALSALNLGDTGMGGEGVMELCHVLHLTKLNSLCLNNEVTTDEVFETVMTAVENRTRLHTLFLARCRMNDTKVKRLANVVSTHPNQFQVLSVDGNIFGREGLIALGEAIAISPNMAQIMMRNLIHVDDDAMKAFIHLIQTHLRLNKVECGRARTLHPETIAYVNKTLAAMHSEHAKSRIDCQ